MGYLIWEPVPRNLDAGSLKDLALGHFMRLITNPQWESLGGPCARCGKYYIRNTKRQKVYCSQSCGARQTSVISNARRREDRRAAEIAEVQARLFRYRGPMAAWKQWLRAETGKTLHWISRAVNEGKLRPPVEADANKSQPRRG